MFIRPVFTLMFLAIVLVQCSEGTFLKAKIIAAKKPIFLAKVAIAKDVGSKVKVAALQTAAAVKAKAVAVKAIALAPFNVAKAAIGIKVAAVKNVKAVKLAKISSLINAKNAPAAQILVPQSGVAVVPLAAVSAVNVPVRAESAENQNSQSGLTGLISGLKNKLSSNPIISTLRNSADTDRITSHASQRAYAPLPLYRVYPDAAIPYYNQISVSPNIEVEVPLQRTVTIQQPHQTYGVPA